MELFSIRIQRTFQLVSTSDIDSNAQQSPETIANLLLYLTLLSNFLRQRRLKKIFQKYNEKV